jgi:hypothetical protein
MHLRSAAAYEQGIVECLREISVEALIHALIMMWVDKLQLKYVGLHFNKIKYQYATEQIKRCKGIKHLNRFFLRMGAKFDLGLAYQIK